MASADVGLVIVAAGSGSRLGADAPKAFVPLAGVPILGHALRGAQSCPGLRELVIVAPPAWLGDAEEVCHSAGFAPTDTSRPAHPVSKGDSSPSGQLSLSRQDVSVVVVPGGAARGDSVAAGLARLSEDVAVVLVHDAARCLTPATVFARVVEAVRAGAPAVVPGVEVVDTIKEVDEGGRVVGTPDRARLRAVQTPQGFSRAVLERAHALTSDATDDAALVERLGEPVLVVQGDERALKITTSEDLGRAARILAG